jgi:putative addiction module component (TIGR02574 family)
MKAAAREVFEQALKLDDQDRAEIAEALLQSLAPEEDLALAALLEQRIAEIDSGAAKTIPWEEFRAELQREREAKKGRDLKARSSRQLSVGEHTGYH